MPYAHKVFQMLRQIRRDKLVAQWQLASAMGLANEAQAWISELEKGRKPQATLDTAVRMAKGLKLGMSVVFFDEERGYYVPLLSVGGEDVKEKEEVDGQAEPEPEVQAHDPGRAPADDPAVRREPDAS